MKSLQFDIAKQNIFFTSDLHFGHANIITFCDRPFGSVQEMEDGLITNWNTVVNKNDIVFILGDFAFAQKSEWRRILSNLNGQLYLILGNHDKESYIPIDRYDRFIEIVDLLLIKIKDSSVSEKEHTFILSHRPLLTWEGRTTRNVKHLFGHLHTLSKNRIITDHITPSADNDMIPAIRPDQMYDVGVDNNDYTPVSIQTILTYFNLA